MTETTTAATKVKTAKHTAPSFDIPDYGIPKFDLPNVEMPKAFREMAEQGVAHARDTCARAKMAGEEAANLLGNTYTTAAKAVTDYNLKLIEIAHINTRAAFDYAQELLGAKSPSEFIELSTAHARKQFEAMAAQTKELTEFAQTVTTKIAVKDWRHSDTKQSDKVA